MTDGDPPMRKKASTTSVRTALPIVMIGLLLFYLGGGALSLHMAVAHPANDEAAHVTCDSHGHPSEHHPDHAPQPRDHEHDCALGHLFHGIAASTPPVTVVPACTPADLAPAPEGERLAMLPYRASLSGRGPPARA